MAGIRSMVTVMTRLAAVHGAGKAAAMVARKWAAKLRHQRPRNTTDANRDVWDTHDWSRLGDEWTPSEEWRTAVLCELMEPHVPEGSRILEIGPGAGRWTTHLLERCAALTLVDVSPVCIEICRERFGADARIAFVVNDGTSLDAVEDASIDAIWSFDAFVHIAAADVARYIGQFPRVLAPGGTAVIHHARAGVYRPSWRSDVTAEAVAAMCAGAGLETVVQTSRLAGGRVNVYAKGDDVEPDVVTVVRKPVGGDSDQ